MLLKEFNANDWEAYGGAERFRTSEPRIWYGQNSCVVASRNGIEVGLFQPNWDVKCYRSDTTDVPESIIIAIAEGYANTFLALENYDHETRLTTLIQLGLTEL